MGRGVRDQKHLGLAGVDHHALRLGPSHYVMEEVLALDGVFDADVWLRRRGVLKVEFVHG